MIIHYTLFGEAEICQHCMAILVKHYIIRLEIAENNISLMQVLNGKQYFSHVHLGTILSEPLVLVECAGHVPAMRILEQHEKLLWGLERVLEANDERVLCKGHDIALRLRILDQVIAHDLLLIKDFHGVLLP